MKNFILILAAAASFMFSISMTAQTTATWVGGKPGRPTDWNCAVNWSEGRIPDEFTQVIIPTGVEYYPVIKKEVMSIDALLMEAGTSLTLQNGTFLKVLGETGRFDGLTILGKIINYGTLEIGATSSTGMAYMQHIQGIGAVINSFENLDSLAKGQ